jgi:hypothetical protein
LKRLQLIQILSINARGAAAARDPAPIARHVNRVRGPPNATKPAGIAAEAGFEGRKAGNLRGEGFTAR